LTLEELALAAQTDTGGLSKLERGIQGYSDALLQRIARALGVAVSELFNEESNVDVAVIGTRRVPVLDYVQAGAWTQVDSGISESDIRQFVLSSLDLSPSAFAMFIRGDSMLPEYKEGDMIVVDPEVAPRPGDFVVAVNGSGEATFKRYRQRGMNEAGQDVFELVPLNPDYPTMRSDVVHIRIVGTVVEQRKFRRK